ncbi:hypothetical protein [Nocardia higoensis]|uniref:hypothetical protein n=1 Tax=Nocardia higoensis TaxID=228599 RepID=UPI0012F6C13C|nr:hypothetical protein [Nocardia higoensis]
MSAFSDFFTQPGFWAGTPIGVIVGGIGGALIAAKSSKASDARKAAQEDKTKAEDREHQLEVEREKRAYEACTELYTQASELLIKFIDVRGIFNEIRDRILTSAGIGDPKASEKIDLVSSQIDDMAQLAKVYNKVKFNAPSEIVGEATELYQSLAAITQQATHPMAKAAAVNAAGKTLDKFINTYRSYYGLETYSEDDAKRSTATYLDTLKQQVREYLADSQQSRPTDQQA